ncbi:hypothetical protein CQW23_09679 [Capsicum baccatum]|uniref:Retrovirus-related Pol polyprotein from transposon TNT 1-94 n=1 Tax=Capsicum baccatum TaxID=33114 RepID=A0A2G2WXI2_CAPBA|nr:hypothetical protein CQW23_09679 [Capsicum baccatum]
MSTKFDIEKFDGKISFAIWRVQMLAVLTQNGLKKVLSGKSAKPATTTEEQWEETDEKALSTIQLCLSREDFMAREYFRSKGDQGGDLLAALLLSTTAAHISTIVDDEDICDFVFSTSVAAFIYEGKTFEVQIWL